MIHVLPLPGSPRGRNCDLEHVYEPAVQEALDLERAGVNGLLLENAGDIPFPNRPDRLRNDWRHVGDRGSHPTRDKVAVRVQHRRQRRASITLPARNAAARVSCG